MPNPKTTTCLSEDVTTTLIINDLMRKFNARDRIELMDILQDWNLVSDNSVSVSDCDLMDLFRARNL
jgi:hypothetical protein